MQRAMLSGLLLGVATIAWGGNSPANQTQLDLSVRIDLQRRMEQVYWSHRIWPSENPIPKPPLDQVVSEASLRRRALDGVIKSLALEIFFDRRISTAELITEWERVAAHTKAPDILRELHAALNNDPALIVEVLVRPQLADRLLRRAFARQRPGPADQTFDAWLELQRPQFESRAASRGHTDLGRAVELDRGRLPELPPAPTSGPCTPDTWRPTSQDRIDPRVDHTAVWTGSELIVWGGTADGGGIYDPVTDTWRPTKLVPDTPTGRAEATAVWTGTEMIVWGGGGLNTGARYNPATDTWTATAIDAFTPAGRSGHTAVWTGTEMIVWGGYTFEFVADGAVYNPSSDSWSTLSLAGTPPTARRNHTAVWTGSKMIIYGGHSYGFPVLNFPNDGAVYDGSTRNWTNFMGHGSRERHSAIWTGTEMIVWGGEVSDIFGRYPIQTGERFNPVTDTWTSTTLLNAPQPRSGHIAVWSGSRMIVWGGDDGQGVNGPFDDGALYDAATDSWTPMSSGANHPAGHTRHRAIWSGTEMIFFGGQTGFGYRITNTGGRYNPSTDSWSPMGLSSVTPDGRSRHTAIFTGSEMIIWGGSNLHDQYPDKDSGGRYDPALDNWTPVAIDANTPLPRSSHVAVWTGTRMLIWGGSAGGSESNEGGIYDPVSDSWVTMVVDVNTPEGRIDATAVWSGTEMIVWGGRTVSGPTDTGGRYDPALDSWSSITTTGAPSRRTDHSAVWAKTSMIVFGGQDDENGLSLDHAHYNPATDSWTPLSALGEPTPRFGHSAVWTGSRMIVWGTFDPSASDLGARYDPVTNSWSTMSHSGPALYEHTAIWTGSEMVVWGGLENAFSQEVRIGGRYDPATDSWTSTLVGDHTPSSRVEHTASLSTVPGSTEMIVWGGNQSLTGGRYCLAGCSALAPGETSGVALNHTVGTTTISWPAVISADRYDVVRGAVSTLIATSGNFTLATDACVANDTAIPSATDTFTPAAGDAVWFLVRAGNCGGSGTYDQASPGQQGARDAEIAAAAGACP
jgi:N-acetylneuraminic acid mutarotase